MRIGPAYNKHTEEFYSVVFQVKDKAAFEEERTRLCRATMKDEPRIPGAEIAAIGSGHFLSYERYANYLLEYIDAGCDPMTEGEPLTFAEWLENGEPEKHPLDNAFVYLE